MKRKKEKFEEYADFLNHGVKIPLPEGKRFKNYDDFFNYVGKIALPIFQKWDEQEESNLKKVEDYLSNLEGKILTYKLAKKINESFVSSYFVENQRDVLMFLPKMNGFDNLKITRTDFLKKGIYENDLEVGFTDRDYIIFTLEANYTPRKHLRKHYNFGRSIRGDLADYVGCTGKHDSFSYKLGLEQLKKNGLKLEFWQRAHSVRPTKLGENNNDEYWVGYCNTHRVILDSFNAIVIDVKINK